MNKPTRVLNILFSYAPSKNPVTGRYIAEGHYATFTVHIQDENASLTKLVSDQIDYLMTQQIKLDVNKDGVKKTADHLKAMMVNLSKMLLYLNLNLRDQVVEKAAEALDRKLVDANPKKRAKIERQAARVYDRIIVGPKSYTPISERFQDGEYGQGRKKPHFRRGTFGIRWKGPVGDQLPELVRISESIVNKDLMVDGSALNYELR
jgi:hypothetical protein